MKNQTLTLVLASILAVPALAQQKSDDHAGHHAAAPAATSDMTDGEVRKIDRDAKKITIRHGEIRNLGMPPMTMVFQVKDGAMLDKLKAGDKVRFVVAQEPAGLVATDIRPAP